MAEKSAFRKVIDLKEVKQLLDQIRQDRGFSTGYEELDQQCGGLVRNGVTLLAGRPGMGKTSLALNMVARLSRQEEGTILIFAPGSWPNEMISRLLSIVMAVPPHKLLDDSFPSFVVADMFAEYYRAKKSNIKVDYNSFLTLGHIMDKCYSIPDLWMVVIAPVNGICDAVEWDKPEEPEAVYKILQKMAKDLNVPVLCTLQLHRSLEKRKNKRPRLGDLKKVGISEDMADQIFFLYRDRYYEYQGEEGAELIIAKVAQGEAGTIYLDWDYETGCFSEKND